LWQRLKEQFTLLLKGSELGLIDSLILKLDSLMPKHQSDWLSSSIDIKVSQLDVLSNKVLVVTWLFLTSGLLAVSKVQKVIRLAVGWHVVLLSLKLLNLLLVISTDVSLLLDISLQALHFLIYLLLLLLQLVKLLLQLLDLILLSIVLVLQILNLVLLSFDVLLELFLLSKVRLDFLHYYLFLSCLLLLLWDDNRTSLAQLVQEIGFLLLLLLVNLVLLKVVLLKDWLRVLTCQPGRVVVRGLAMEAVWVERLLGSGSLDDIEGDVLQILVGDEASSSDLVLLAVHSGLREDVEGFHDVFVFVGGSDRKMVFVLWGVAVAGDRVVSFVGAVDELQFSVVVEEGKTSRSRDHLMSDWLSEVSNVPKLDLFIVATILSHCHQVVGVSQPDELWRFDTLVSICSLNGSLLSWVKDLHSLALVQSSQHTTIRVVFQGSWLSSELSRKDLLLGLDIPNSYHVVLSTGGNVKVNTWMPVEATHFFSVSQFEISLGGVLSYTIIWNNPELDRSIIGSRGKQVV
jgi:hypothetical protein